MQIYQDYYLSPLGIIEVKNTANVLKTLTFVDKIGVKNHAPLTLEIIDSLKKYFNNKQPLKNFNIDSSAFSNFQKRVYELLLKQITLGTTISYKELALKLKTSPRAIGRTMASNPVCLFIPCHRVIKSNGNLGGYSCGIHIKEALLKHEGFFI